MRACLAAAVLTLTACGAAQEGSPTTADDPLDSISGEELFRRGEILTQAGDFVRAEQYYAAAIRRGFPEERALPSLLRACVEGERLVAALSYAEPFLERHPTRWSLRLLVASIHMGLEHHAVAHDHLERVLRDAPEEPPEAHYFLGVLYRDRLDDRDAAARHFERYLALAPGGPHTEEARASIPALTHRLPIRVDANGVPITATSESTGAGSTGHESTGAESTGPESTGAESTDPGADEEDTSE